MLALTIICQLMLCKDALGFSTSLSNNNANGQISSSINGNSMSSAARSRESQTLETTRRPRRHRNSLLALQKRDTIQMQHHFKVDDVVEKPVVIPDSIQEDAYNEFGRLQHAKPSSSFSQEELPAVNFSAIEENTIELLVVVTHKMKYILKDRLITYLVATMGSLAQNFKHPSLKASVRISIVDMILLDAQYARRQGLDDWSKQNHETVMEKFCQWVNKERTPSMNWDSAILLNVGNFKSTALGVAHYRSMCSRDSSCLVVVDRGFGTADIITHELGHQLGSKHDFEIGSTCGLTEHPNQPMIKGVSSQVLSKRMLNKDGTDIKRDTIMSGILFFELYPFRWSACSRHNIQHFLSRPDSACLRKQNSKKTSFTPQLLDESTLNSKPGERFTLNEQCELAVRQRGAQFCGQHSLYCKQLHCYDVKRQMCLPYEAPWAEGSGCGFNKWCLSGVCTSKNVENSPVHGGWSDWHSWGSCSRTCGGGVQYSKRICDNPIPHNGGNYCLGANVQVRSCNVNDCHSQEDVRQNLCDEIGLSGGKQLHAYHPKFGESSACKLVCLEDTNAVPHNKSLPDGVPCFSHLKDICIHGKCWKTGCNKVLGSQMRTDNCNVCGGDNSTCEAISGVFRNSDSAAPGAKPIGLTMVVHIPHGVTNVFVRKVSRRSEPFSPDAYDDFMLLIFEELKTRIRRGETHEPFAGAELYYSGSRGKEEVVRITGLLTKDVNILIRVENKDTQYPLPDVEYTYYVNKKNIGDRLRFEPGIFDQELLGVGNALNRYQRSSRQIAHAEHAERAHSDEGFTHSMKDKQTESPILFVWRIDEVPRECSNCAGTVTNQASCYPVANSPSAENQYLKFSFLKPLPPRYCNESTRPSPTIRHCIDYCGVRWSWQRRDSDAQCSDRCGDGEQVVLHVGVCEEKVQVHGSGTFWRESQLGDFACIKAGLGNPPKSRTQTLPCTGHCAPVDVIFSNWTKCSNDCGHGSQQRNLTCVDSTAKSWPITECLHPNLSFAKTLPTSIFKVNPKQMVAFEVAECFDTSGCKGSFEWASSDWSICSVKPEYQTICQSRLARKLNHSELNGRGFGFPGVQTRQVKCVLTGQKKGEDREAQDKYCEHVQATMPHLQQECTSPVCYRWGIVKLSECSTTCGTGTRVGRLSCERVQFRFSGTTTVDLWDIQAVELSEPECLKYLGSNVTIVHAPFTDMFIEAPDSNSLNEAVQKYKLQPLPQYILERRINIACETNSCRRRTPIYMPKQWSVCSKECGLGIQMREIACYMIEVYSHKNGSTVESISDHVSAQVCESKGLLQPPDMRLCEISPCAFWAAENWTKCEGMCEAGNQTRNIRCVQRSWKTKNTASSGLTEIMWNSRDEMKPLNYYKIEEREKEIDISHCDLKTIPRQSQACLLPTDCPYWHQEGWSSCSKTCGIGWRYRQVDCRYPNGTVLYLYSPRMMMQRSRRRVQRSIGLGDLGLQSVPDLSLSPICLAHRPIDRTECHSAPCQNKKFHWWPIISSNCSSVSCTRGYQERVFKCLTTDYLQVNKARCARIPLPMSRVPCSLRECKQFSWRIGPWSYCPLSCGNNSRYRSVRCVDELGEEYADQLCTVHLRPHSWSLCHNACQSQSINCWDVKRQQMTNQDGIYDLSISNQVIQIYCSHMNTDYPREYLPLRDMNYAANIGNTDIPSEECTTAKNSRLKIGHVTETLHETPYNASSGTLAMLKNRISTTESSLSSGSSLSIFRKLRINLDTLKVDIFDSTFTETIGKTFVPIGSAKSCSESECSLGLFVINLKGTGFAVSKETIWRISRSKTIAQINRFEDGSVVEGFCGGDCGACWPNPSIKLSIIDQHKQNYGS